MQLKSLYPTGACKGTTKEGKKCGIRDIFQNGYCRHHGGQGTLVRVIFQREKLLKKCERLRKKAERNKSFQRIVEELKARNPNLQAMVDAMRAKQDARTTEEAKREALRGDQEDRGTLPMPVPVQERTL